MSEYKLGVIIPNYNRSLDDLYNNLKSLNNVLFLVVDDKSLDSFRLYNESLLNNAVNWIYYSSSVNQGPGMSRILGITLIHNKCDYVTFLDSDDMLNIDTVNYILDMELTADVYGFDLDFNGKISHSTTKDSDDTDCSFYTRVIKSDMLFNAMKEYTGYCDRYGEDIEFMYLLKLHCDSWINVSKVLYVFNVSDAGQTNKVYHNYDNLVTAVSKLYKAALDTKDKYKLSYRYMQAIEIAISGYRRHHMEYDIKDKL